MPYKSEKGPLPDELFDARTKLLKCQRDNMKYLRELGMSFRGLARQYNISVSTAFYICDPSGYERKKKKNKENMKELRESDGYDKQKAQEQRKKSRHRKHVLSTIFSK